MKNTMRILIFLAFPALLYSCNQNESNAPAGKETHKTPAEAPHKKTSTNLTGCYMRILERDTMVAHLQQEGNRISGKLSFDNYQKDGSSGMVKGMLQDSIIRLVYDFHSEGMKSVMDIHFLVKDSALIRGIGDMEVRGDTAAYSQPASLSYPTNEAWKQIACESVPSKYKQ